MHLLRETMWWVLSLRSSKILYAPSGKLTGWLARLLLSPRSNENPSPAWKWCHPRRRLLELRSLMAWGLLPPWLRELWPRSRPFELAPAGEPASDPTTTCARSLAKLLRLPQPGNVDGSQVGARLADFAPHWRSLLGNCRATGNVEDGVGIAFQQRPQLTHQSITFRTRNSRQDLQQAVDALLMKGAIEQVTNVTSLGYYSRLFLISKKTGDLRPVIDLSTLNRHMVVPHFMMETHGSVRSVIRSQEWTVSVDICNAYLHVPMHQAVRKYLHFVVNKKVYQFTCLPYGLATSPREFTKLLRAVVSLLRQQGVKLHVYLDDWLIRADTPEQAQLHAQTTIRVLQFLGWIINYEKSDLTPSRDFQFIGMQFNTQSFTVAPLPKMRLKVQSVLVLSEVAWWASPAVLQGLPLVTMETEVTLFTDASSSGWGAQLGSRSTQGQWSAFQQSWHINVLEMQAVIYAVRDFLLHLRFRVVRLMCDNAVTVAYIKNEGGTRSPTLMQMTIRLLKWCDCKAITLVPVHLPGVHNIQADSLSRVGQTLTMEWYDPCLPSGLNHGWTCLRHSPTDEGSSSNRRIRTPGQSGQMPWPCLGTTGGASCTRFRHSRWSLKYCRRSLSHQEWRWFWLLNCNQQRRGFQSWWISPKKIRSRCTSRVKTCWHKTFGRETGWPRLVTSDRQIYTRGNSAGHPEGEGPFQGSCQHDVKVPSEIFTASVRIPLVKICGVL